MSTSRSTSRTIRLALSAAIGAVWLALAGLASAQSDAERMGLVGPVASVAEYQTYEPQEEEPRLRQEWTFDADGEITGRVFYSYSWRDGSLNYRQVTTYDATSGLQTVAERIGPDGAVVGRVTYAYDGEGRPTEEVTYDENGEETYRIAQEYDRDGNLIAREIYRNGELAGRDEYDYDGEGRRVAGRDFDDDGTLDSETTYTVPDLEYETVEYDDGEIESRSVVVRGEHGVVSAETYLPDGTLESATYFAYDEAGRIVRREDAFSYDVMGETRTGSSVAVYEYEFDEVGNWIRRTAIEDDGMGPAPIELEVREIEYR